MPLEVAGAGEWADLTQPYQIRPKQIYARRKRLPDQAGKVLEAGGGGGFDERDREIGKLHARIGH